VKLHKRLSALEAEDGDLVLHYPEDGDDHTAAWRKLLGKKVGIVIFPGLNDEAAAAFTAAKTEGGR
jgi:hypothetical protein